MEANDAQANAVPCSKLDVGTFNRDVAARVRHIRTDVLKLSIAEMAATFGVGTSTIQRYESGDRTPDAFFLVQVADRASVSLEWLLRGHNGPDVDVPVATGAADAETCCDTLGNPVDLDEFVFIPRYSVKAAAGYGAAVATEEPTHTMAFRRYWIENYLHADPADLSVLSVRGDSQQGVLNDRDVILIDRSQASGTAGLYVLRIDGEIIVKTLQRLPEGLIEVSSANPAYKSFTVNVAKPPSDFAIIGRVVWFARQI